MQKTKIEWCDSTWNPVTGCLHGCEYCYARKIANRFDGGFKISLPCAAIDEPQKSENRFGKNKIESYPYGFNPTFYRYRLDQPTKWKEPRNIFVCSMADLFGKWVPDDWEIEVLKACAEAPQHNYLFLTKDPIGYSIWPTEKHPNFDSVRCYTDNMWLGVTYTGTERLEGHYNERDIGNGLTIWSNFWYLWRMNGNLFPTGRAHKFISIEPLKCDICEVEDEREGGKLLENFLLPRGHKSFFEWVIVGAETGNRKRKAVPDRKWIEKIVDLCKRAEIPIFMKCSLKDIWGEPLIQEYPKELQRTVETPSES